MKKRFFIILLALCINSFAQKQANIWYFGRNAGIDFNTTPPSPLTDGQINTLEGCSSFSSKDGNLLFYSDGTKVWDKNHDIMRYSDGRLAVDLRGDSSSTQSGMIIPKPKSDTLFYLFTVDDESSRDLGLGLNLYTIDISKNGGNGEIIENPINLSFGLEDAWTEKIAAVRGAECNTFWVVSVVNNTFYSFKIDDTGINTTPVISTVSSFAGKRGYLKLSPDGTKLAIANELTNSILYDFSPATGKVGSTETILTAVSDGRSYGVEFSVDSKKLYISTASGFRFSLNNSPTTYKLFQFDLNKTDISQSKTLIYQQNPGFRGALQLGPDSRIYGTVPLAYDDTAADVAFLDVIENPTADAEDVIFTKEAINLGGQFSTQGLPPFISSLLLPIEIIDLQSNEIINNQNKQYCTGDSIEIKSGTVTGTGIIYEWAFNSGIATTVISNQSKLSLDNLSTRNNGIYLLTVLLTNDCGDVTKLEGAFNIEVFEPATATPVPDISFCDLDGDGLNSFNLEADITPQILGFQDPRQFEVLYYTNQSDADNNTVANAITGSYTNSAPFTSQDIFVRIHNRSAPDVCYDITQFSITVIQLPNTQPVDYQECDDVANGGNTDGFFNSFILSSKDSEILGSLPATEFSVTYHTSLAGAQTGTGGIIDKNIPYRNTVAREQTIYVRVENISNPACVVISDPGSSDFQPFKLLVNEAPVLINNLTQIKQCDTDTNLTTTINLTKAQINISNNHLNEAFKYYRTEYDAINNISEITDPTNITASDGESFWVRTLSEKGCYRISKLDVIISFSSDISYNQEFTECDDFLDIDGNDTVNNDDTDGITNFDLSEALNDVKVFFPPAVRSDLDILFFESEIDRNTVTNQIPDINSYRNSSLPASTKQHIFIKIINRINNACIGLGKLFIRAAPLPDFSVTSPQTLCLNNPSFIEAENSRETYNYEWIKEGNPEILGNNRQFNPNQGGKYQVTAVNGDTGCSRSKTITVNESITATVTHRDITVIDDSDNNSIRITTTSNNLGRGDYEFALQDENLRWVRDFQDEPFFENLRGGIYTILIRDKNNCGISQIDVSVLEFPDFFTPNNDGINDTWTIKGGNSVFYPESSITIFDRFGKIIASLEIDSEGWNGLYNGRKMPSNDYWFTFELTDINGNTYTRKGHFSLLLK